MPAEAIEKQRQAMLGRKLSKEHKRKIAEGNRGKKQTPEARRKMSAARMGMKLSPEHRRAISRSHRARYTEEERAQMTIARAERRGVEYRLWRDAVLARDKWTCQKCGKKGDFIRAHHIIGFNDQPNLRTNVDNGITLCKQCHVSFHSIYGKGGHSRAQLTDFMGREV